MKNRGFLRQEPGDAEGKGEDKTVRRNGQHENKLCQEARTVSISGTFQG